MLVQNISRGNEILKTFWYFGPPYYTSLWIPDKILLGFGIDLETFSRGSGTKFISDDFVQYCFYFDFVQLDGFVHVNSCRCLDGVGRMVRVRSFFIQLQEVQIPPLHQCSFGCCLRWRSNWNGSLLRWLFRTVGALYPPSIPIPSHMWHELSTGPPLSFCTLFCLRHKILTSTNWILPRLSSRAMRAG